MDNDSDDDDDDEDDEYPLECWRSIQPSTARRYIYIIDTDMDLIEVM